jgi:hypothetical protein
VSAQLVAPAIERTTYDQNKWLKKKKSIYALFKIELIKVINNNYFSLEL